MNSANHNRYFLCIIFKDLKEKHTIPLNWCFNLPNVNQIQHNRTYDVFFSMNRDAQPTIDNSKEAYILKYYGM